MKKYCFVALCLYFTLLSCSCKRKILDSPGFPPSGHYFSVDKIKQPVLDNKQLVVKKLDPNGNIVASKTITEVITISEGNIFRIADSWTEVIKLFSEGENTFLFDYGNDLVDTIVINSTINLDNNTVKYNVVKYNSSIIQPIVLDKPAQDSKIYQLK